jgi:replicative DNA helicase
MNQKDHVRAGEADIILAKQRNGPTDKFAVMFQGQYSRFVNKNLG